MKLKDSCFVVINKEYQDFIMQILIVGSFTLYCCDIGGLTRFLKNDHFV